MSIFKKNDDELDKKLDNNNNNGYSETTADEISKEEERRKKKENPGRTTLLYRQVNINRDMSILAMIIAISSYIGVSISSFKLNTGQIIQISLAVVVEIFMIIWIIHTPQGKISKELVKKQNKFTDKIKRLIPLYKFVSENKDLGLLGAIVIFFAYFGFSSFSGETIGSILSGTGGIAALILRVFSSQGEVSQKLSQRGNKNEEELDVWGLSSYRRK